MMPAPRVAAPIPATSQYLPRQNVLLCAGPVLLGAGETAFVQGSAQFRLYRFPYTGSLGEAGPPWTAAARQF